MRNLEREISGDERVRPDHRPEHADHGQHGRRDGGDDPPHGQLRPQPDADVHAVRQRRLLLPEHVLERGREQGVTPAPVTNEGPGCPAQGNGFAWNHGDIQPQIATTWQGWVGPGIANLGQTSRIWTDHTDARPTLMTLLGLRDDYTWDGRAIEQILDQAHGGWRSVGRGSHAGDGDASRFLLDALGAAYKQLDAPFGSFGLDTLDADTSALAGTSAERRQLPGHRRPAPGVRERPQRAGAAHPDGAAAGRDRAAAARVAEAVALIARANRLIADAQPPGELRDPAGADALQLTRRRRARPLRRARPRRRVRPRRGRCCYRSPVAE